MASIELLQTPVDKILQGTRPGQLLEHEAILQDLFVTSPNIVLYTASSIHYENARSMYNQKFSHQPLAIIRPTSVSEVSAVVRFAKSKKLPLSIRGNGHDIAGRGLVDGGLTLDVRSLDWIRIPVDKESAYVGAGITSGKLTDFLQTVERVTPTGWCNGVGYAGFALGGGYGILSSSFGMACDQLLGATVVLADGEIVDTDEHPDLLWALRGAGNGTLGVVVELRTRTFPSPAILAGFVGFGWDELVPVMSKFSEIQDNLPDNYTGEVMFFEVPGAGPAIQFIFVWVAKDRNLEEGHAWHEKIKALGTPIFDTVAESKSNRRGLRLNPNS
jgi:FAD/FMN-containing dehydrogenase